MVGVDSPLGLLPMVKQKGSINDAIIDGYRGSLSATAAGYLNVLHFIEVRDLVQGACRQCIHAGKLVWRCSALTVTPTFAAAPAEVYVNRVWCSRGRVATHD
jgi:uncharacterized membrane protein